MTSSPGIGISSTSSESEDGGSGSVNGGGTTLFTPHLGKKRHVRQLASGLYFRPTTLSKETIRKGQRGRVEVDMSPKVKQVYRFCEKNCHVGRFPQLLLSRC